MVYLAKVKVGPYNKLSNKTWEMLEAFSIQLGSKILPDLRSAWKSKGDLLKNLVSRAENLEVSWSSLEFLEILGEMILRFLGLLRSTWTQDFRDFHCMKRVWCG